jgi:hypothetical protein
MSTPVPAADTRPEPPVSITAPALGVIGAAAALLTGAWLMYAPFLLGYQPDGAEWADATVADFWAGLGLAVLALIALGVLTAGLLGALTARGALTRRPGRVEQAAPAAPAAAAPADDLTNLLRPLVEALNRDNGTAHTPLPGNHQRVGDPAGN